MLGIKPFIMISFTLKFIKGLTTKTIALSFSVPHRDNPSHDYEMAPSSSKMHEPHDLDQIWRNLREGLLKILDDEPMPMPSYMKHYSQVYDYCTSTGAPQDKQGAATSTVTSAAATGNDNAERSTNNSLVLHFIG